MSKKSKWRHCEKGSGLRGAFEFGILKSSGGGGGGHCMYYVTMRGTVTQKAREPMGKRIDFF